MISFADNSVENDLKRLWRECFGADDKYLNMYFGTRYRHENTLVYLVNQRAAAMLTMLPICLAANNKEYSARYIFAVATLSEYRGRGLSTQLLKFADDYMSSNNIAAAVLAPANASLFGFYRQRGYSTLFNIKQVTVNCSEINCGCCDDILAGDISAQQYAKLRDASFADASIYAKWDVQQLEYIKTELELFGGGFFSFKKGAYIACAALENNNETVKIKEIITDGKITVEEILACICKMFAPQKLVVNMRQSSGTIFSSEILPYAMIKWYNNIELPTVENGENKPYISLVSD
ncbi:MAG TPA: hypothetical protein DCP97_01125 [Ruminococcaceae bacterium]|nr:hypothetical protein [Oscillospiraceae bacterium]